MQITVHYGIEQTEKFFSGNNISVGEVIGNSTIRAALGYGDNVKGLVSGVEQPHSSMLSDGDHLYIEVKANSKAVTKRDLEMAIVSLNEALEKLEELSYTIAEAAGK